MLALVLEPSARFQPELRLQVRKISNIFVVLQSAPLAIGAGKEEVEVLLPTSGKAGAYDQLMPLSTVEELATYARRKPIQQAFAVNECPTAERRRCRRPIRHPATPGGRTRVICAASASLAGSIGDRPGRRIVLEWVIYKPLITHLGTTSAHRSQHV